MSESALQIAILCVAFGAFIGFIGSTVSMWIVSDLKERKNKKAMKIQCRNCGSTHPVVGQITDVYGRRTYYARCTICGSSTGEYRTVEDARSAWWKMNRRKKYDL